MFAIFADNTLSRESFDYHIFVSLLSQMMQIAEKLTSIIQYDGHTKFGRVDVSSDIGAQADKAERSNAVKISRRITSSVQPPICQPLTLYHDQDWQPNYTRRHSYISSPYPFGSLFLLPASSQITWRPYHEIGQSETSRVRRKMPHSLSAGHEYELFCSLCCLTVSFYLSDDCILTFCRQAILHTSSLC